MCKYYFFLIFLFIKTLIYSEGYSQKCKNLCHYCCDFYFCKKIFHPNSPEHILINTLEGENNCPIEGENDCSVCLDKINDSDIEFVCGQNTKHFCHVDCFLNTFLHNDAFLFFNNEEISCPFCKKNNIPIVRLENFILNNSKFNTNEKLNEIKKLLAKKKENNTKEEIQEQSLENLKKEYQELNKCCQDESIINELGKNFKGILCKPCPCCNITIYKETGTCNAIRCPNCKCYFCWLCGWFSFNQTNGGHAHFNFFDCVKKDEHLLYKNEYLATYYGWNYLFGKQEYIKPRFFKVVENDKYWGTEKCEEYLNYKDKITEERYEIETYMTDYSSSYVPSFLVPENNDPNISPKIYRWDSSLEKIKFSHKVSILKKLFSFIKKIF